MNTPLSSFTALVKFKFDKTGLTDEIKKVRTQLQGLHDSHVRQKGKQASLDKAKEKSLATQLLAETKLVAIHAKANRENAAFDKRRIEAQAKINAKTSNPSAHLEAYKKYRLAQDALDSKTSNPSAHLEAFRKHQAAQAKIADKGARDNTAAALKWQRVQDSWRTADERAAIRVANKKQREMLAEAYFMNREFNLRRANAELLHSEALRMNAQVDRQRSQQRLREHSEALRMNREFDRQRLRQNRPPNSPANSQGGNTNPWHIGTMAGGLGGLITRGNLAAVGAGAFTQQSFTQANFDIAQAPQFEFIAGSAEEAAKQVAFLNKEVDRLSLPLRETSNMYRQLLASTKKGLGIEKTQELFSSFSNISTMLGLSSDAQSRGLRAFAQMSSKGQVMSEELKGQ